MSRLVIDEDGRAWYRDDHGRLARAHPKMDRKSEISTDQYKMLYMMQAHHYQAEMYRNYANSNIPIGSMVGYSEPLFGSILGGCLGELFGKKD